jgi:UDP-3-O-[3-hydroxymyristoyl] N-acetylglucosamine deacetylase
VKAQRTIARPAACSGSGLHTGAAVRLRLLPAPEGAGIAFVRECGGRRVEIPARPECVASTTRATTLERGGVSVATVEHLLAACFGLGVDNLRAEVEGPELPAFDGSAAPFVELLLGAGLREQASPRRVLGLARALEVREGERWIRAEPSSDFSVDYTIDYAHPAVGRQRLVIDGDDPERFARELAPARTFGFLAELPGLLAADLARGGSLASAIVFDGERVLNPEGLRFPDELVRHKVLDLLGDLALLGARPCARVRAERAGHGLHRALVAALRAEADAVPQRTHG